jgi:hypothetical protein
LKHIFIVVQNEYLAPGGNSIHKHPGGSNVTFLAKYAYFDKNAPI